MYYGLTNKTQIIEMATAVCNVLGNGSGGFAVDLLLETCAAETLLGTARDNTLYGAGAGVAQVDEGTYMWLQDKFAREDRKELELLKKHFNIDLSKVSYCELDLSPLLSLIFCRLRYRVVAEPIPHTLEERAKYWKIEYNSTAGKGTPEEYVSRCRAQQTEALIQVAQEVGE